MGGALVLWFPLRGVRLREQVLEKRGPLQERDLERSWEGRVCRGAEQIYPDFPP